MRLVCSFIHPATFFKQNTHAACLFNLLSSLHKLQTDALLVGCTAMKTAPVFHCDYNSHFATFTQIVVYSKRPCGKFSSAQHCYLRRLRAVCSKFHFIVAAQKHSLNASAPISYTHTRGNFHADEFSHLINCLADESERQVRGAAGLFALRIIDHRNYFDERRKLYASTRGEAASR
jgi:hypothetical protein